MTKGIIFNIMKYSIHDGPGIRTTVFLKGCPLSCVWCHNPESQAFKPQVCFLENRCMGCGDCVNICPEKAISTRDNLLYTDTSLCVDCGACAKVCPTTAMEMLGRTVTTAELIREIDKDRIFYEQSCGGVTFSGGEPFSQPEFLEEALRKCKRVGLHTAVDTSGYVDTDILLKLNPLIDLYLYDLKLMDEEKHLRYTGVSNKLILENARALTCVGARLWPRIPVIPGINDDVENLHKTGAFIQSLGIAAQASLLPYHNIAKEKYRRLNRDYALCELSEPDADTMKEYAAILNRYQVGVK